MVLEAALADPWACPKAKDMGRVWIKAKAWGMEVRARGRGLVRVVIIMREERGMKREEWDREWGRMVMVGEFRGGMERVVVLDRVDMVVNPKVVTEVKDKVATADQVKAKVVTEARAHRQEQVTAAVQATAVPQMT